MDIRKLFSVLPIMLFLFTVNLIKPININAHCDTLDGPVVIEAKKALENGDITPLLKWISANDEQIIRKAFQQALEVRKLSDQARDMADMYFFETLVRIHRAGEGAPYTGLKSSPIDPAVVLADKALDSDSAKKLIKVLSGAMEKGILERFQRTLKAKKKVDKNVNAGREFVEAYVQFTHYVEGLHKIIKGGAKHDDH